ncbi:MAG: SusC/RagA family TonB-linked outer membrane protein [Paludibacteraceae bacterium]|nr:SusC/RagA family TonB-linked outer membrane protein [Paludibacteraceae bacterium]
MKNKFYVFLVGLLLSAMPLLAQTKVTGTILEDSGQGAIGANVIAEGTTVGTVTDFDGNFELMVPAGVKHLVISYIGFKTETVPVKPVVKLTLQSESTQLEDVVVTGMVAQDKRMFTGAATKVDADKSKLDGVADVSRSLEGRAAGVSVQNVSGTFGTAPKIRVRGATSIYGTSKPLWVVDGVILEDNVNLDANDLSSGDASTLIASAIAGINADDIESFQILKDGSATSIYGARAMAGVIVVTTKKGKAGQTHLNYTGELTMRLKPSYDDYNICTSQEQMGIYQELSEKGWLEASSLNTAKNTGVYGKMFDLIKTYDEASDQFAVVNTLNARNAYLREAEYRNTDWFDQLFNTNVMMNHSVSYSMGTDRANVYASLSAMYDPGWYKKSSVQRYTASCKANFDLLPKESKQKLTLGINTNGSYRKQEAPGTNNRDVDAVTGVVSREFDINPFSYSMNTSRALDPKVTYRRNYCGFNIFDELNENYIEATVADIKFQGELTYKPIKGLEFKALGAIRYSSTLQEHKVTENSNQARAYRAGIFENESDLIRDENEYLYADPDVKNAVKESVLPEGGIFTTDNRKLLQVDFRGSVQYRRGFANGGGGEEGDDHLIDIFAGAEINRYDRQETWFRGWGYQYNNGGIPYYDYRMFKQGAEEGTDYYTNEYEFYRNVAFFAMASYNYQSRYSVTGTFRYEGSNQLGKSSKSRWLPTWNVSGAWTASNERWWQPTFQDWWSYANLKASYSLTADRGPATNSLAVFQAYTPWRFQTAVKETGIELAALENSELTYEKKHEFNIGTSLGFFKNRLNFEFDYYIRNNYDLIGYMQTTGVGGEIRKLANYANMKSSGQELTISTVNIDKPNFRWTTDLIFSHTTNKITNLQSVDNIQKLCSYGRKEGYPIGALFSIPFAGLDEDGLPTFWADKEHTKRYTKENYSDIKMQDFENTDFLKYEGTTEPTVFGSFNNTFQIYKNLKIGIFFTYSFGNVLRLNDLCFVYPNQYNDLTASSKEMKNRWAVSGDENKTNIPVIASKRQMYDIPGLQYAYSAYNYSDQRVAKGDFIRLKEISIEYSFPKKWFEGQKAVSSFSAKLSGTNLALLYADKKLNGQDPEYYNTGGVSSPIPRQFTLTFRLGF